METVFALSLTGAQYPIPTRWLVARPFSRGMGWIMLILTRKVGESVMIGNDITVKVLGVNGNRVRIGINAPKSVEVHREEIYEEIKRQGKPSKRGDTPAGEE